ncbi:MAG: DUF4097 family beta strand repeat-containing protein [SAR202 cluster bacterium]|jgi:DUF4097 and DUF4098 domain-containing protein YvlB|nr:DUF4097 family beta strand repeat-containing protein [SAR202 cluster bacterium]
MGRGTALIAILALAMIGLAGCQDFHEGPTEIVESVFEVGDSVQLEVNGFNGSITVSSGVPGQAVVRASLRQPDRLEYSTHQDGDKIVVTARRLGNFFDLLSRASAKIDVTVPRTTYLVLNTSNGKINVDGVEGGGSVNTSNGAISVTNADGDYTLGTSNGRVTVENVRGTFDIRTSNGGIEFDGELLPGGNNRIRTSNGSVSVNLPGVPSISLDASTSNGSVVSRLPMTTISSEKTHLKAKIGDGDAELNVRTSNGSITFR